jgi:hypothetical protein
MVAKDSPQFYLPYHHQNLTGLAIIWSSSGTKGWLCPAQQMFGAVIVMIEFQAMDCVGTRCQPAD